MIKDLKKIAIIIWIGLTILYGIKLYQISKNAGVGAVLDTLREQSDKLMLENIVLENEIASRSSLIVIEKRAEKLGFSEQRNVVYIK